MGPATSRHRDARGTALRGGGAARQRPLAGRGGAPTRREPGRGLPMESDGEAARGSRHPSPSPDRPAPSCGSKRTILAPADRRAKRQIVRPLLERVDPGSTPREHEPAVGRSILSRGHLADPTAVGVRMAAGPTEGRPARTEGGGRSRGSAGRVDAGSDHQDRSSESPLNRHDSRPTVGAPDPPSTAYVTSPRVGSGLGSDRFGTVGRP
jgi:hypothetical protein